MGQLSSDEHNSFQSSVCPATFPSFSIPPSVVPRPFRVSPRVSSQWLLSEESTKGRHLRGIQIRPPALRRSDTSSSSGLGLHSMNSYPTAPLTSVSEFSIQAAKVTLNLSYLGQNKPSASPCWEIPPRGLPIIPDNLFISQLFSSLLPVLHLHFLSFQRGVTDSGPSHRVTPKSLKRRSCGNPEITGDKLWPE